MKYRQIAFLVAAALVVSPITTALAQGGGGAGGSGGGSGGASASGGASGSGTTTGTAGGTTINGMNSQQSQSTKQTIQDQKNAATTGINTAPSQNDEGIVSGPGVGVGTATNGKPIGSPGSGLGSPENPVDARKLR
jgi:hypothetical protein